MRVVLIRSNEVAAVITTGTLISTGPVMTEGNLSAGVAAGIAAGVLLALWAAQYAKSLLFEMSATDPLTIAINDVNNGAAREAFRGLLDHLLKDPGMRRSANDFQFDLWQTLGDHGSAQFVAELARILARHPEFCEFSDTLIVGLGKNFIKS